jgi:hypothetical protein
MPTKQEKRSPLPEKLEIALDEIYHVKSIFGGEPGKELVSCPLKA